MVSTIRSPRTSSSTTPDARSGSSPSRSATEHRREEPGELGPRASVERGGDTAKRLLERSDEEITELYQREIFELFPTLTGHIVESHIQRWTIGGSYRSLTEDSFEPLIDYGAERGHRIRYAGDYFAPLGQMEVAVTSGKDAADAVRRDRAAVSVSAG